MLEAYVQALTKEVEELRKDIKDLKATVIALKSTGAYPLSDMHHFMNILKQIKRELELFGQGD